MSWPPEGSKPPATPRPAPAPGPRAQRPSPPSSPGETTGEAKVKPQAKASGPTPPQFGHDGIDPRRAALLLGLPVLATTGALVALFAPPTVVWIASGVAATAVAAGVVLRRSRRARGAAGRLPGVRRMPSVLRRASNGRFARSPLGRAVGHALGRPSPGGASRGSASRPRTLGRRLRSFLPSWAGGGTRKASPTGRPGGTGGASSGGRPGGRMRSLLSRLKPGGPRRPGGSGGRSGTAAEASPGGRAPKTGSLLDRATRSIRRARRKPSPETRPGSPAAATKSRKTKGTTGKKKAPGGRKRQNDQTLDLDTVKTGVGKARRLVGAFLKRFRRGKNTDALEMPEMTDEDREALAGRHLHRPGKAASCMLCNGFDAFDGSQTYEIGIDGEVINGQHVDPELGEIAARRQKREAKRARKLEKRRAKEAERAAKEQPEWPATEPDDGWPSADPDEAPAPPGPGLVPPALDDDPMDDFGEWPDPPTRSLPPDERHHDPPPSPPASPPSHRETRREAPRITSANTGGKAMAVSPTMYNDLITSAVTRREGWEAAAAAFRRNATELEEKSKDHDAAARALKMAGDLAAAEEREEQARQLRDDANTCTTYAGKYQEKANTEQSPAA